MPAKITIEEIKKRLPPFVRIIEETYRGKRYTATFYDKDFGQEFEAVVANVIKLQHGCKDRSDKKRSETQKGIPKSKISLKEIESKLPNYIEIVEYDLKRPRKKWKFYDKEFKEYFYAYLYNILRDKTGYCKSRYLQEFSKKIKLSEEQINSKLKKSCPDLNIRIIYSTYESVKKRCLFDIDGEKILSTVSSIERGMIGFYRNQFNYWRTNVFMLWGGKCAISGSKDNLECHHIYSFKHYPSLRYVKENGILLNKKIHTEFHQKYGKSGNNYQQLLLFLNEYNVVIPKLVDPMHIKPHPLNECGIF